MKPKNIAIVALLAGFLVFHSGCMRSDVDDPSVNGQSGSRIILEAWANPSWLYIPLTNIPQPTTIYVKATAYDGRSLAGRQVLFQQYEPNGVTAMSWGYFEGAQTSLKKTLDGQGMCQVNYWFPGMYTVNVDTMIWIRATLMQVDDLRVEVFDFVPIYLRLE